MEAGWRSRGYLPHFEDGETAQTINLRLADSLPRSVLERWTQEHLWRADGTFALPGRSDAEFWECPNLKFSAPPLRSLRLGGELFQPIIHRRDAEVAETAQRKTEIRTLPEFFPALRLSRPRC